MSDKKFGSEQIRGSDGVIPKGSTIGIDKFLKSRGVNPLSWETLVGIVSFVSLGEKIGMMLVEPLRVVTSPGFGLAVMPDSVKTYKTFILSAANMRVVYGEDFETRSQSFLMATDDTLFRMNQCEPAPKGKSVLQLVMISLSMLMRIFEKVGEVSSGERIFTLFMYHYMKTSHFRNCMELISDSSPKNDLRYIPLVYLLMYGCNISKELLKCAMYVMTTQKKNDVKSLSIVIAKAFIILNAEYTLRIMPIWSDNTDTIMLMIDTLPLLQTMFEQNKSYKETPGVIQHLMCEKLYEMLRIIGSAVISTDEGVTFNEGSVIDVKDILQSGTIVIVTAPPGTAVQMRYTDKDGKVRMATTGAGLGTKFPCTSRTTKIGKKGKVEVNYDDKPNNIELTSSAKSGEHLVLNISSKGVVCIQGFECGEFRMIFDCCIDTIQCDTKSVAGTDRTVDAVYQHPGGCEIAKASEASEETSPARVEKTREEIEYAEQCEGRAREEYENVDKIISSFLREAAEEERHYRSLGINTFNDLSRYKKEAAELEEARREAERKAALRAAELEEARRETERKAALRAAELEEARRETEREAALRAAELEEARRVLARQAARAKLDTAVQSGEVAKIEKKRAKEAIRALKG
jgi:hypothetical protein